MFSDKNISNLNATIAIANANDDAVIGAVIQLKKWTNFVLYGPQEAIEAVLINQGQKPSDFQIVNCPNMDSLAEALALDFKEQKIDALMKGNISTKDLMKIVLNKKYGFIEPEQILFHLASLKLPNYHKHLWISDAAININPSFETKKLILENSIRALKKIGYQQINVACLSAVEKVTPKMVSTLDASELASSNWGDGILVEGPLAFDNAISKESTKTKNINSKIAGEVDFLLMPNIESGNIFYKTVVYLLNAQTAGVVLGAKIPIILTSRSDSEKTKINSIRLGLIISKSDN